MAYKQNNPLSRRSSSPLFRKQGISPLNSRRMDENAKKIAYPKAISRRSSSPINRYPTAGTFAGSLEEAEALHAPGADEQYVNIGDGDGAIWDLQTAVANKNMGGSGRMTDDGFVRDSWASYKNWKPSGDDAKKFDWRDARKHPLGPIFTHQGMYGTRDDHWRPDDWHRPLPDMMPVTSRGITSAGNRGIGGSIDFTSDINDWGEWTSRPNTNPFTGGVNYWSGTNTGDMITDSYWDNSASDRVSMYQNPPKGGMPWQFASERFGDVGGPNLFQEGMTAIDSSAPSVYPFFSSEGGDLAAKKEAEAARGASSLIPKIFGDTVQRGLQNRINVEDAFSTYLNRDTVNMDDIYRVSDPRNPSLGVDFSDQFKVQFPQMLLGGETSDISLLDKDSSIFKNALSSSRFRGGGEDRLGYSRNVNIDNPVDIGTKLVSEGILSRDQLADYIQALNRSTFRGTGR